MSLTSQAPHSCDYCQKITIDLGHKSISQLGCGIEEALTADRAGCPLFRAFLDSINTKVLLDSNSINRCKLNFAVRYEKENLPDFPATLVLIVSGTLNDGTKTVDIRGQSRLALWTSEDDSASVDITTRPYELDYASPTSVGFARSCIQSCQLDHEGCRRSAANIMARQGPDVIEPDSIPSRLLRLVSKDSVLHVKLIGECFPSTLQKEVVSRQGFAILSYCWGETQPMQLTHGNISDFEDGVPITQLPKSLRDAAWFTNEMGLNYLWIDALCILQDDVEDKIHEISRMELYYGQSTVTICAASASRCSEGFLMSREEDAGNYSIGPIQLRAKTSTGTFGYIQALDESDSFNMQRPAEPIALRGWTLQEALLSRRILIFSSRHLYFTCTVANASCGGLEPMLKPRVMTSFESRVVGVHTLSGLRDYPVRSVWDTIVREYTTRSLGVPADKLPAVSAMASNLIPMAKERGQNLVYLAGLMLDTSDADNYYWRTELLWAVSQMKNTCHVSDRSPSWSWSSVDGSVKTWGYAQPNGWSNTDGITLCEYGVELENEIAPFGTVKGGFVKIHARTRGLDTIAGFDYAFLTQRDYINDRVDTGRTVLALCPDTSEREEVVQRGIQGKQHVFFLELIPFNEKRPSPAGIIITQMPGVGSYVRVGMFEFQGRDNRETAAEMLARQTLFNDSPFQDVHII
ncbi:HET-domain-containing protein [Whalleya microplaca]|nr:HET-domain-containing protein [Whalleya microplaca]